MATLPLNISEVQRQPVFTNVRQSPPLDLSQTYDESTIRGKHVLITGGASGFGAATAEHWAQLGASVVIADVNVARAEATVAAIRKAASTDKVWFVKCDVRSWEQQAALFREAATRLSPHGGIDVVVANAGVAPPDPFTEHLVRSGTGSDADPAKPDLTTMDIDLTGVLYTSYLAVHWLARNPGSKPMHERGAPATGRDRHLLLVGSLASLAPLAGAPLYGTAKHGVLGLFRSLRSTAMLAGMRVNMLCPYFIMTDIVPAGAKLLLAGGGAGEVGGFVEGVTRLTADVGIRGRALVVGPKVKLRQADDGEWQLVGLSEPLKGKARPQPQGQKANGKDASGAFETQLWEAYADDFEDSEALTLKVTALLNAVTAVKGWSGWFRDIISTLLTATRKVFRA